MITPSDIIVSVYEDKKSNPYRPNLIVEAALEVHEMVTIGREYQHDQKAIDYAKEKVRHGIRHRFYGDLCNSIEEMYAIAMVKMPYCQELNMVRELKGKIDKIMRGET